MDTSSLHFLKRGTAETFTLVSNTGEQLVLDWSTWMGVRNVAALVGGWQPAGTEPPEGWDQSQPWAGGYDNPEGQRVTEADALALANALAAASTDILAVGGALKAKTANLPAEQVASIQGSMELLTEMMAHLRVPQELLEAQMQSMFAEHRAFFRKGAFRIHE